VGNPESFEDSQKQDDKVQMDDLPRLSSVATDISAESTGHIEVVTSSWKTSATCRSCAPYPRVLLLIVLRRLIVQPLIFMAETWFVLFRQNEWSTAKLPMYHIGKSMQIRIPLGFGSDGTSG
jgi:hypothetical protein